MIKVFIALMLVTSISYAKGILGTKTDFNQRNVYYLDIYEPLTENFVFQSYLQSDSVRMQTFKEAFLLVQDDQGTFRMGPGFYNNEVRFKLEVQLWR